jgi:site-specific DNA-cytosine methylase
MTTFGTLFSGGGIADCGFESAGMTGLWGVEFVPAIADVFRANHAHPCHVSAVEDMDPRKLPPVDHLHVSPSCKNASRANTGAVETEGDSDAARGICNFIKIMKPAVFTLENVWRYRTFDSFKMIIGVLADLGYFVSWRI